MKDRDKGKERTVSVIIPTYNRSKKLNITIGSFVAQNYPKDKYEIIISNNNSTDNTAGVINEYLKKDVEVKIIHHFEKRQGVHYARNSAAKIASGDILYFTDDDMIADMNLLCSIIKPFEYDPKVAVVGGKVLPFWLKTPPNWVRRLCTNLYLSLCNPPYDLKISDDSEAYSCHEAILKGFFFRAGGFNPENTCGVWLGDGESGLARKIKDLGFKFAYTSEAIIYHMIPPERMTQSYLNKRFYNQGCSDAYAFYKYFLLDHKLNHRILLFYANYIRQIGYRMIRSVFYPQNIRFCIAYLYSIVASFKFFRRLHRDSSFRQKVLRNNWLE